MVSIAEMVCQSRVTTRVVLKKQRENESDERILGLDLISI